MKPRLLVRWLSVVGVAALSMVGTASAADVHVMISAGFHGVYSELGPAFERASGHHLGTTRGPSIGDSPGGAPPRRARGPRRGVRRWPTRRRPSPPGSHEAKPRMS